MNSIRSTLAELNLDNNDDQPTRIMINGQEWHNNNEMPNIFSGGTEIQIQFDNNSDFLRIQYILFDKD